MSQVAPFKAMMAPPYCGEFLHQQLVRVPGQGFRAFFGRGTGYGDLLYIPRRHLP
jgi:hypothetical protein